MPRGDISGWHNVFSDNFTGRSVDSNKWHVYGSVAPGGDPFGWFDPSHVKVSNGQLVISGYQDAADGGKWATGGLSSAHGLSQTYGKYLVRFRMDRGNGISHAILLLPANGSWPPEVDFSEDNGGNRQTDNAFLHYGAQDNTISRTTAVDLTHWHILGVEWTAGKLVYTLDGRAWATVTGSEVPSAPMVLDLQTQAWACGGNWESCPDASTPARVNMYVDWVVAYAPVIRTPNRSTHRTGPSNLRHDADL